MTVSDPLELVLVLEQTLGNVVHGDNVERVAHGEPGVAVRTVRVPYEDTSLLRRTPVLGTWTTAASLRARRGVRALVRERPADAVFVHTQCSAQLLGSLYRRLPVVVSMDATPANLDGMAVHYAHGVQPQPVERVKRWTTRRALHRAAGVVTWSHWAGRSVVDDYGVPEQRVHVVRPGVRLDRFRPRTDRAGVGPVRLLFVGGDFERKGGPELLEAVRALGPAVHLDVVTSHVPADLPAWARAHVGLGHDSPELFALYSAADVFVVPTRGDAYGLVYPEAMACGLPVVACDVGAVSELVVHGQTGLLVPPRSTGALTSALRTLVEQPVLRQELGRRGLELARAEHDADRNGRELVDLLRRLTAGSDAAPSTRTARSTARAAS